MGRDLMESIWYLVLDAISLLHRTSPEQGTSNLNGDMANRESSADSESETEFEETFCRPVKKMRKEIVKSPVPSTSIGLASHDYNTKLPSSASSFKEVHLDRLGLFYANDPLPDLETLIEKTASYVIEVPKLKDTFQIVVNFLEECLSFDASHYKDHVNPERWQQDRNHIFENLKKLESFSVREYASKYIQPDTYTKEAERMLETIYVSSVEFLSVLIYFMDEEVKSNIECCFEKMYRQLYTAFFPACGLSITDGECVKKALTIFGNAHTIISEPDLRSSTYPTTVSRSCTVMVVGEVKRRLKKRIDSEKFCLKRDLAPYNVLGQHGAELLVELHDTCFTKIENGNRLVFGAICAGTQMLFTALEMTQDHFEAITEGNSSLRKKRKKRTNLDSDELDLGNACIYYTRPYDLLKASDRRSIYEPLVRLACVQKHLQ